MDILDGYDAKISCRTRVDFLKMNGFKSHDCHVFMQNLIPIAFRDMLPKRVVEPLFELSCFFRDLCSTNIKYKDVELWRKTFS